ncbi:MAG: TetR/AcrR family transcriptional regulator [Desulfobacteraceae bacterium]|nr:TetR/AcrR family transcriptional regulator [Desulfobacteraceae bacterium]
MTSIPKETTQQKLIKAAIKVFAEKGFRDATVRQICKQAGTANINAVNYYFGSKEQLYKQILELIFAEYDKQAPIDFIDKTPEEQLVIYISTFCKILYQEGDSDATAIIVEEFTKPSPFLEEMVDTFNRPRVKRHLKMFKGLLGEGATDDMARDCLVSVSGQLLYYSFARPVFSRLFPDYFTENSHEQWAAHVFKFTLGGIEAYKREFETKG